MGNETDAVDDLVALLITAEEAQWDDAESSERERLYDEYLNALVALPHARRREAFGAALPLLSDSDPLNRSAAADLIHRLAEHWGKEHWGKPVEELHGDAVAAVLDRIRVEDHDDVLSSLVISLGKLNDPATLPVALQFVQHPAAQVRWAVAWSVPTLSPRPPPREAVEAVVALTRDEDDDVRDWATFGLGRIWEIDSEDVRAVLAERLTDEHLDTREEAVFGLAVRGEARGIDLLADLLAQDTVSTLAISVAEEVADPRFLPSLLAISEWWGEDKYNQLARAIAACGGPAVQATPKKRERQLP